LPPVDMMDNDDRHKLELEISHIMEDMLDGKLDANDPNFIEKLDSRTDIEDFEKDELRKLWDLENKLHQKDEQEAMLPGEMLHDISEMLADEVDPQTLRDLDEIANLLRDHKKDLSSNPVARTMLNEKLLRCASDIIKQEVGIVLSLVELLALSVASLKTVNDHKKGSLIHLQDIARHVEELEFSDLKPKQEEDRDWLKELIISTMQLILGQPDSRAPEMLAINVSKEYSNLPKRNIDFTKKLQLQLREIQDIIYEEELHNKAKRSKFEQKIIDEFNAIMSKKFTPEQICAMDLQNLPAKIIDAKGKQKKLSERQKRELAKLQNELKEMLQEDFEDCIDDISIRSDMKGHLMEEADLLVGKHLTPEELLALDSDGLGKLSDGQREELRRLQEDVGRIQKRDWEDLESLPSKRLEAEDEIMKGIVKGLGKKIDVPGFMALNIDFLKLDAAAKLELKKKQDQMRDLKEMDWHDQEVNPQDRAKLEANILTNAGKIFGRGFTSKDAFLETDIESLDIDAAAKRRLLTLQAEEKRLDNLDWEDLKLDAGKRQKSERQIEDAYHKILSGDLDDDKFLEMDINATPGLTPEEKKNL
jgi:hypothetical protein